MNTTKKKVIAIATSDWHIHKFQRFNQNNSRLGWAIKAAQHIFDVAKKYQVPILFSGDLYHTPKEVDNETNAKIQQLFAENLSVHFIGISGNHDMSEKNTLTHRSPTHLDSLVGNIGRLEIGKKIELDNFNVWGIPYLNNENELISTIKLYRKQITSNKPNILLLHTDYFGATLPNGMVFGETKFSQKSYKLFRKFKLALFGHIHKPQRLFSNGYMLGSPIHQISSDMGTQMGYWYVLEDFTLEFKPLLDFPQFMNLEPNQVVSKDTIHYYITPQEAPNTSTQSDDVSFSITQSREKLAKKYLKVKNIKSKTKKHFLIKLLNSVE